jgi:hypothetical protein
MASRAPSLFVQKVYLDRYYPGSRCTVHQSELRWRGQLQPTSLSHSYVVKLGYKLHDVPRVHVVHPTLAVREGEKLPHVYEGNRLCLYLPRAAEWSKALLLAETIVPWASEWLLHYEVWLATGVWAGGGQHPNGAKQQAQPDREGLGCA